jgi:hypothetical protein
MQERGQTEEHSIPTPSESLDHLPAGISLFVPAAESTITETSTSDESSEKSKALKFIKHGILSLLPLSKRRWTVTPITILDQFPLLDYLLLQIGKHLPLTRGFIPGRWQPL